jgi:hypothetical protein
MPQVQRNGLTDFCWQRHEALAAVLAAYSQAARVPVDIFEQQREDFATPQTQARQEQQDGPVTLTDGCRSPCVRSRRRWRVAVAAS